jgi:hypothetical protein
MSKTLQSKKQNCKARKRKLDAHSEYLKRKLFDWRSKSLESRVKLIEDECNGLTVGATTLSNWYRRNGIFFRRPK